MVKVTIFGATGTIGKNVTFQLARSDIIDEIVLFARKNSIERATGELFDMYDALTAEDIDCKLISSYDYKDIKNSDIVLITAGVHRTEGMSRLDLAIPNSKIVHEYSKQTAIYAPDSIILVATNPVDVMTTVALEASGFNRRKVIGLGNHLDSLRLKTYISKHLDINSREVHTRVIGEHGEHMVPLLSSTTIGGIPLDYFVEPTSLDLPGIVHRLKTAGSTIISKKGVTEYGPAYAISNLIQTILTDSHKILTVSIYLQGEILDISDVCLGVPVILYRHGILMVVPISMDDHEKEEFLKASQSIKEATENVRKHLKENS